MASDPRLNLTAFASVSLGAVSPIASGFDSCPSSVGANISATLSANIGNTSISLSGEASVGAFQNLQLGQGGGQVGAGLTGLAAISNNIRIGGPPTATNTYGLPSSTNPGAGSEFVLQSVGLSTQTLNSVGQVNASVATTAQVSAGNVYAQVQAGTFTNAMIPGVFSDFQNAATLAASIIVPALSGQASSFGTLCGAKPYAVDLIRLAPKYKFLYIVQFEFHPSFQTILNNIDPAFVTKTAGRPQIQFEYEDVNMYNFRTKVPRRTIYEPITLRFYDDDYNNVFQLYNAYLKIMSPIANVDITSQAQDPLDAYDNVGGGMGFTQTPQQVNPSWPNVVGQGYAASLGPYGEIPTGQGSSPNIRNVLRRISIFHVYRQGTLMNVYHFYNPKFLNMTLDDLDMASAGEGSEVALTFAYDSVYIIPGYRVLIGNNQYNLAQMTSDGMYPFGAPSQVPNDGNPLDGTGHSGGVANGQAIINMNSGTTSTATPVPSTVSSFVDPPTTLGGTSFVNMTAPAISNGGSNTTTTIQGNTPTALANVTTTTVSLVDPVTGNVPQSADNSGNIGNVLGTASNVIQAGINTYNNTAVTDLAQSVEASQTLQSTEKVASDTAATDTTSYNKGGNEPGALQ